MATTASSLISKALTLLSDTGGVRWPETEMLDWLNDAQREIVTLLPRANTITEALTLDAGVTKQSLPATGIALVNVHRNMGADGATPGAAITIVKREDLDLFAPDWHSAANAAGKIYHFVFDPEVPKVFHVYPKAPATAWAVEISYSEVPTAITNVGANIVLPDEFANAILNYLLFRAYSKDAEFGGNAELAMAFNGAFRADLGLS